MLSLLERVARIAVAVRPPVAVTRRLFFFRRWIFSPSPAGRGRGAKFNPHISVNVNRSVGAQFIEHSLGAGESDLHEKRVRDANGNGQSCDQRSEWYSNASDGTRPPRA